MNNQLIAELKNDPEIRETFAEQDQSVWVHQADMLGLLDLEDFISSQEEMKSQIRQVLRNHGDI
ncbi:hypothetical protein [Thioalkalivibrio sp. ALE19]|uniref:hypothetical protein n=1 Tax=Thioalkalivibrio sp. ALE19 TaxID=1266909 RepID=UPI0004158805|nr:hypothetical protein [Thioalkalivibrio sp. ALE19]